MPLDATVGGASANSYLTVAAADSLAASDIGANAQEWAAAPTDEKEAALIRASDEIDSHVGRVVSPFSATQALLFPRVEDVDAVGVAFLPARLRKAVYLQAAYLLKNATIIDQAAARRARGLVNFANPDGTSGQLATDPGFGHLHPRVEALVGPLTEGAVSAVIIPT